MNMQPDITSTQSRKLQNFVTKWKLPNFCYIKLFVRTLMFRLLIDKVTGTHLHVDIHTYRGSER